MAKMSPDSIRSIVISFEEYERLKHIEQQFEALQSKRNKGNFVFLYIYS